MYDFTDEQISWHPTELIYWGLTPRSTWGFKQNACQLTSNQRSTKSVPFCCSTRKLNRRLENSCNIHYYLGSLLLWAKQIRNPSQFTPPLIHSFISKSLQQTKEILLRKEIKTKHFCVDEEDDARLDAIPSTGFWRHDLAFAEAVKVYICKVSKYHTRNTSDICLR